MKPGKPEKVTHSSVPSRKLPLSLSTSISSSLEMVVGAAVPFSSSVSSVSRNLAQENDGLSSLSLFRSAERTIRSGIISSIVNPSMIDSQFASSRVAVVVVEEDELNVETSSAKTVGVSTTVRLAFVLLRVTAACGLSKACSLERNEVNSSFMGCVVNGLEAAEGALAVTRTGVHELTL